MGEPTRQNGGEGPAPSIEETDDTGHEHAGVGDHEQSGMADHGQAGESPVAPRRPWADRITRWGDRLGIDALSRFSWRRRWVGSERPWCVSPDAFPEDGTPTEQARFLLRFAVLAPSSHNTQPWAFNVSESDIRLFADLARWLTVADPDKRELYVSLGAALENLLVAADHYGMEYEGRYLPGADSAHAATVRLSSNEAERHSDQRYRDQRLLDAILRRRTDRSPYRDQPIPRADLQEFQDAVVEDDVTLQFVADPATLDAVADLTARADRRLFADPAYRRELGRWIGRGAFGDSWLRAKVGKYLVSALNVGRRQASRDRELIRSAPLLAIIRTKGDGRRAQIRTGQVYERVSLLATTRDVKTHSMSASLEVPALRRELTDLLGDPEWSPQHLFRLGYAADSGGDESQETSPRRPLEAVLVE